MVAVDTGSDDRLKEGVELSTVQVARSEGSDASQVDLNGTRIGSLGQLDEADFRWFHVKVCLVAGVGFFTDAYDIFAINIASTMLGYAYGHSRSGTALSDSQELGIKIATPIGTLFGQLLFGWLADVVGRKRMYGVELMIIIVGTFAQALAGNGIHGVSIIGVLIVWRFIMGIGIGGDYPVSAGWGQLTASLVAFIVVMAYKSALLAPGGVAGGRLLADDMWRLVIGLGCVPGAIALYFRLTIPETPRFTMDVERNVRQAAQDVDNFLAMGAYYVDPDAAVERASRRDFGAYFSRRENALLLFGTAYSWFALDIAFYGINLNSARILQAIGFGTESAGDGRSIFENLHGITVGNLILSSAGLVPGYWVAFCFIDRWGRKPIQLMGFIMLTVLFIVMGAAYNSLKDKAPGALLFLICLANFFQNFGPNTTTFIVPGEAFPTRYRSTAHGISAACGKLGAIISQVGFAKMVDTNGQDKFYGPLLLILAFFMLTGVGSTLLIKETKQMSLEDISNERQDNFLGPLSAGRGASR